MLEYMTGFGNHFETEALEGALPKGQNSPQKLKYNLYAEQLSGTAFTMPQTENFRSWLYRIQPSVVQSPFSPYTQNNCESFFKADMIDPNSMRWNPYPYPKESLNFVESLKTFCVSGSPHNHSGSAIHMYAATSSMEKEFFYNADGEFLIVPEDGDLILKTEMGTLEVSPLEIAVIPRGIKFQVVLKNNKARGYICENFGQRFRLPDRGPIGANALANPRDFKTPTACFENQKGKFTLIAKCQGQFWQSSLDYNPLNVVAWHGNYAPYKYDLRKFCVVNTVSFDHPDPSIFTVLTSPTSVKGLANVDFVIFPPRWMVAEHSQRLPWFHRNVMSEYMGLIEGQYDAKEDGFLPGGGSLHNCMSAHGPEADSYFKDIKSQLKPQKYDNTMAFMFESASVYGVTEWAQKSDLRQKDYHHCWQGLKNHFE